MAFAVPDFAPGEVRRAGEILRQQNAPEDLRIAASEVLSRWRAVHLYPLNTFQATLRSRLRLVGGTTFVGQRLKRAPSVVAKLQNRPTMRLQQMQDIAGLRAIVASPARLRQLDEMYCGGRKLSHKLVALDDYIANPKSDGYRSKHLVFRYSNPARPAYDGLHIELQLRTRLQHAWATAVETVDVFMDQSIKAGRATPEWARFFSLASVAFAKLEGLPVLPVFERVSMASIGRSLRSAERTLDVVTRLRGFRVATNAIISRERDRPSFLHLVVLNTVTRTLSFRSFSEAQQEEANIAYTEVEQLRSEGQPLDPVLVAGGNLRQLKKSYPNYFADTDEFVRHLTAMFPK